MRKQNGTYILLHQCIIMKYTKKKERIILHGLERLLLHMHLIMPTLQI